MVMNNKKNEISTRRSQLSPAKQALLEKRLRGELKLDNQQKSISRRSQYNPVPLSFSQQRLWFLAQLEPNNPFYNVSAVVRLQGKLNFQAIQDSLQEIINRHEVLRCNFQTIEDEPVAFIHATKTLYFPLFDLSELSINQQKLEVNKLAHQEASQPFDLSSDLLLRAKLLRLNPEEHILLFTMHHIVSDGWSIGVLIHELATLYKAFCEGETPSLAELPIQYGDFAIWQQDYLQGEALTAQKNYWKQKLSGSLPVLQLPTDYPRPAVQSYKGKTHSLTLSKSLTTALKALSQQAGATLFMTLLTAFKILLYRYSQQEDIIIGTAIANRNLPQIEKLIGFFVNTLVLRTDFSGNPNFLDLLARVKETTLDAYTHQDLPFEKLVEEIQPERNLSHNPLFQVWFSLNNSPMPALQIGELTLTISEAESETAQFDLSLNMVEQQEELIGIFEYSSDLFNADTINRIAEHFQTLLAGIIVNPKQQIASLHLLTALEQQQLLREWNNTEVAYPDNKCIHELFEQQVERTPDAVALVYENQQLTYSELNTKANQLAHYLRSLEVKPEVKVGICLERSLEMVIGLLAILKAGGAYIPLDPNYPQQRLEYILKDTQAPILLTQASLLEVLPQDQAQVVCLDNDWYLIEQQSQNNLYSELTTENLAYIIYTSGSTGKPKGVQIPHIALSNFLYSMKQAPGLTSQDKLLAVTTYSFDIAALEIFLPIIVGACLIVASQEIISDGNQLLAKIKDSKATVMQATPATWQLLLAAGWDGTEQLKILCGGEALSANLASKLLERCNCVWNMYGPTETTIWSAAKRIETVNNTVTISSPIANTQLYILDKYNQLVPVGVAGELCIGGAGLARGYFQRPQLTAERFIPNPLSNEPSARLYKTGDLARYLPNGEIEYLGRIDNQVKIRGFRIELGEIETVISQYPQVRETVITVREDAENSPRIVAYVVPQVEQTLVIAQLREFLESKLPNYMIPATFVELEALPLTPNGKVDRKALPTPESRQLLPSSDIVPAATPIEKLLTGIWAEILGIEKIGIYNHFFELGGHSLIATRVISQIRQVFQVELPLRCLFEKPTIAQLATEIKKAMKVGVEETKIEPISRLEKLPLSFAQQRLWFLAELEQNSASYNIPVAVRLQGQLNVEALQQSFHEIINRHEALRTNFYTIEGQAIAVIHEAANLVLSILDISHLSAHQLEAQVKQQVLQVAQTPFDLKEDLLLRVKLLRLSAEEHVLLLTMHHIVSDGWSTGVLVQEFATLYQAFCRGESLSPLAPLPIQYVDFAAWQRQWLQGEVLETQMTYWRKQLADAPKVLELPTDYPRPAIQTFRGTTYSFNLSHQLSLALNKLSQQQGTTLFMTLLAAFQTLLSRYTGSEDLVIGSAIANRNRAEIEGLIGVFVNTLVLRTNLAGNPSFAELLKRVREVALGAYAHQDLPFELLVEELQPQRNLSHTPLFQVMFVLQNAPMSALELPNLTLSLLEGDGATAKFDLTLDMTETRSGLIGTFEYNSDLFQESTIKRMAGHLQTLLEGIVANPQQRLSQLPLLTPSEQQQLLQEWNDTEVVYPDNKCIHELFEQQVERTPDTIAVVYENQQLTYTELNTKANQLAHYLRSLEVKPEVKVGICTERSLEMVIGLLAILKAGGAYIPLDPNYPQERLAYMLEDSQPRVLLTQQHLLETLPTHGSQVICINSQWELITRENTENPVSYTTVDNLAYIIYTSGSTGKPKGAMNSHRGVCNRLLWMQETYQLTAADTVLQKTPFSFDVSVWEFFWTLITGARLVVAQPEGHKDPNYLVNLIIQQQITTLHFVPSMLQAFLEAENVEKCQSIKRVLASGEALPTQLQQRFFHRLDAQLHNLYGPTEAAIDVTFWQCQDNGNSQNTVPIGRPIANIQIYLLDKYLHPVPVGVTGEIYIGGVGVGRGYLNRPQLTAEKFIPNPFSDESSARLYKTGDLARYLPNGEIEYIGRIDHQVKIRGFRIELGEIEAIINQHPSISASVVIVREDETENKSLVAYITVQPQQTIVIPELRGFLESKLPNYMVTTAIVVLEALPLTPNGKIDRRALPAPDLTQLISESNYVAPATPVEEMLAGIWAQVIGLERVGVNDNFFDLGGHSLIATRVISQIRQVFEVEIPLRRLFELSTVNELAKEIQAAIQADKGLEVAPIKPIARSSETGLCPSQQLPLSFAQQRLWFLSELEPNSPFYNIPAAVRLEGQLNLAALEQSFNEILRRHEVLRTNFRTVAGQAIVVISPATPQLLSVIDLSELPPAQHEIQVRQLALTEAQQPFNLEADTLLRVQLLRLSEQEYVTLLTMHHIVSDEWSIDVLVREVATLYQAFCQGKPSPLPEHEIQYADFAAWQRQWFEKEVIESQLAYWLKQLDGAPAVLELPTDYPRPAIQSSRGATYSFCLSKDQSLALKSLSRQQGSTLFMTLLAAFKTLLHRYTGSNDIVIGSPIANRNHSQIEGLIGFFVNTLVLRTNLADNPSFLELLHRVKEVALGAYTHQDTPFELLVEKMQPQRDLSHTPLFQVMFALQNAQNSEIKLPGVTLSTLETDSGTAKFDLTLDMRETEEGLVGTLEYSIDLFELQTIQRMAGHLQTLLSGIIANPEQQLSELPLLTAEEQSQLLVDWNQTQVEYSQNKCIHQLFEKQVEKTPDAVAVVFENEQLTYRQLNQRANQLGHYLQKLGVGAEVLVGICVERSLDMAIALLGILKAGGVYVPLDPNQPQQRLDFMLQDAECSVLLTQKRLTETLRTYTGKVIYLDADWKLIAQEQKSNPTSNVQATNLAYLIYTSGSTGKSKGVMVEHSSLVNAYYSWEKAYQLDSQVRCHLQMANFSFDVFTGDLVRALCSGGKLVLCPRELLLESQQLYELICQQQVDCAEFVPVVLRNLVEYLEKSQQKLDFMRLVICGSDSWYGAEYQRFRAVLGEDTRLINSFGVTEATIDSSYFEPTTGELASEQLVPIGRPYANNKLYILDANLQPVPIGVMGELYIGGNGLARGYHNRPDLTAEKFIPNIFSQKSQARLYKTGDLVRYLPDGNIEFLGRIDNQIKLRGFRIELGEIEALLSQNPAVSETVVVVREDIPGNKRLVAYIVANSILQTSDIRNFLKDKLPNYMIPSAFVQLDVLPLTPNGKIDRRTLPTPATEEQVVQTQRTPIEEVLAGIWTEILSRECIGNHDNFFDLGGHSLLATQVISRIRDTFKIEIPLSYLFDSPTIAECAQRIETKIRTGEKLEIPPIKPVSRNENLPLSFAQQRLWLMCQLVTNGDFYNNTEVLKVSGQLNIAALKQSINEIVRRHEVLRTTFPIVQGQPTIAIAPSLTISLPVIDLRVLNQQQREAKIIQIAIEEAKQPFDLTQGPLFRVTLLWLDSTEYILLLNEHHIISDGWSMGIWVEELTTLYEAYCAGKVSLRDASRSPLPELPIQYVDFAVWQRQWLQGKELHRQLEYWHKQLGQNLTPLQLPTDKPRPAQLTYQGQKVNFLLPLDLTKQLQALSHKEGVTLFMTLLAVFKTLLYCYSGQADIRVGSPIANRNRAEIEKLIGFFVNTLVLHTDLSNHPSFRELLGRVREVTVGAYAHQDLPFEKIVEELQPERYQNHLPFFQVWFVLQNAPLGSLKLPDLTLESLDINVGTSRYDLGLFLVETSEGISGYFEYSTDLFFAETITRLVEHFKIIINQIVAEPGINLDDIAANYNELKKVQKTIKAKELESTNLRMLKNIKRQSSPRI
jgi:amino acid adenylation domain-containing protein